MAKITSDNDTFFSRLELDELPPFPISFFKLPGYFSKCIRGGSYPDLILDAEVGIV